MKLRWWIAGAITTAASSILEVKHFTDSEESNHDFAENNWKNSFNRYPSEIRGPKFDDLEFLL